MLPVRIRSPGGPPFRRPVDRPGIVLGEHRDRPRRPGDPVLHAGHPVRSRREIPRLDQYLVARFLHRPGDPLRPRPIRLGVGDEEVRTGILAPRIGHRARMPLPPTAAETGPSPVPAVPAHRHRRRCGWPSLDRTVARRRIVTATVDSNTSRHRRTTTNDGDPPTHAGERPRTSTDITNETFNRMVRPADGCPWTVAGDGRSGSSQARESMHSTPPMAARVAAKPADDHGRRRTSTEKIKPVTCTDGRQRTETDEEHGSS